MPTQRRRVQHVPLYFECARRPGRKCTPDGGCSTVEALFTDCLHIGNNRVSLRAAARHVRRGGPGEASRESPGVYHRRVAMAAGQPRCWSEGRVASRGAIDETPGSRPATITTGKAAIQLNHAENPEMTGVSPIVFTTKADTTVTVLCRDIFNKSWGTVRLWRISFRQPAPLRRQPFSPPPL